MKTLFINNTIFDYVGDTDTVFCVRGETNLSLAKSFVEYAIFMGADIKKEILGYHLGWTYGGNCWISYEPEKQEELIKNWAALYEI